MTVNELKRILGAFVNDPSELDVKHGRIVAQVQDDLIDVALSTKADTGDLVITDGDTEFTPRAWILRRVARLDLLADRILSCIPSNTAFVVSTGVLRGDISSSEEDDEIEVENVLECLTSRIVKSIPAASSILYLTSDAGEGKTTLINQVARLQAESFKSRKVTSLLVPIPLGGRPFLRFDDVVIGTLSNKFRFNRYYFDGFLELVRLGAIVPAFDGFEEMFVEGHSGEAVSALGNLIDDLDSAGSIVVAARKAFFEITSFRTQARLFDSIGDRSASFSRLKINRWGKAQFIEYANLRNYPEAEHLYALFSSRLPAGHPMLSRAFLVERLVDLAAQAETVEQLAADLGTAPQDYFFKFVETLIEREAKLKWLDKSGEASQPLMSLNEHHELLGAIAREMWQSSVSALRLDIVDVIVDLFSESKRRSPTFARQVRERIRNHSLLAVSSVGSNLLEFDHDEFRRFYLGEALGRAIAEGQQVDLLSIVSADRLPPDTCDQALNYVDRARVARAECVSALFVLGRSASPLSFARENCGALLIRFISEGSAINEFIDVQSISFPLDALVGRNLARVNFRKCQFESTGIAGSKFSQVLFEDCDFERIDLSDGDSFEGASFVKSTLNSLKLCAESGDRNLYGPNEISSDLIQRGAHYSGNEDVVVPSVGVLDPRIDLVEKFLRVFLRATQVNEDTIRAKFGKIGSSFVDDVLPELVKANIVEVVEYRGRGVQQRYKLAVPMQSVQRALIGSHGNFSEFLGMAANK